MICCSFLLFSAACIERFAFEADEPADLLVVDGRIDQSAGPYELRLSRTTAFGSAPVAVGGAQVTVYDELGNQEAYHETEEGVYQVSGRIVRGMPGRTYHVEIQVGSRVYRSQPQTMPFSVQADSAYAETMVEPVISDDGAISETTFIKVYVDTPVRQQEQDIWLRWKYDINYAVRERQCGPLHTPKTCYVNDTTNTQSIAVFSSENTDTPHLSRFLVVKDDVHPRYAFYIRHYFNIYQFATTKETYTYWEKIKKIANQAGSIFDTPPAPVHGNIYNVQNSSETVLGFFEVSSIDTVRALLRRGDLQPLPVSEFCGYLQGSQPENSNACCNCLLLENSTLERPHYWDE